MHPTEIEPTNTIDRRTLIRNFLMVSAGIVFLPSCSHNEGKASIVLKNIPLSGEEEAILAALCETIIPATNTPGARELGLHLFVMKMLDDCYLKKDQENIIQGFGDFKKMAEKNNRTAFAKCTPAQQQEIVRLLEKEKVKENALALFYKTVKKLTIQGYTTSKYYLTEVHKYELVPGRYHGCVPVSNSSTRNKTI